MYVFTVAIAVLASLAPCLQAKAASGVNLGPMESACDAGNRFASEPADSGVSAHGQQPDRIAREIRESGAARALRRLYADQLVWDEVLDGIASGDVRWLGVAASLMPSAEAGSAHDLFIAVGDALEASPERVLELLKGSSGVGEVCGDIGPGPSRSELLKRLKRREDAVREVRRADLQGVRGLCLNALSELRSAAKRLPEY